MLPVNLPSKKPESTLLQINSGSIHHRSRNQKANTPSGSLTPLGSINTHEAPPVILPHIFIPTYLLPWTILKGVGWYCSSDTKGSLISHTNYLLPTRQPRSAHLSDIFPLRQSWSPLVSQPLFLFPQPAPR